MRRGPDELRKGVPIRDAGRFQHEAVAVDPRTGVVYEHELVMGQHLRFHLGGLGKPLAQGGGHPLVQLAAAGRHQRLA